LSHRATFPSIHLISGSAVNGSDYNPVSNFVLIPAGAFSATVTLTPQDDPFAETF